MMKQVEYYKNGNRTLRIKYEGIKKLLKKKNQEIERLNNIIGKIRNYVYKPIDKEWDDILCIIEDGLRDSDKE